MTATGSDGQSPSLRQRSGRTVLLTGASGIVGQALLKKLTDLEVICLTHRAPLTQPGVRIVQGDLLSPRLGLSNRTYDELLETADCVVHAAANTNFSQAESVMFQVNVEGTRNVVDFAVNARIPLYHFSTAFVALCEPNHCGTRANAYARSKAEAEEIVTRSGVQAAIVRPSRIIGDSRTGAISRFQGFHFLFDLMVRGEMQYTFAPPDAYVDFVPQDVVANVLAALIKQGVTRGEYWVTAGEASLRVERMMELCREHIFRLTGRSVARPEPIRRSYFEEVLKPALLSSMPSEMHSVLEGVIQMMDSLNLESFRTSLPDLVREFDIPAMPDPESALLRNLQYWARRRGLLKAAPLPSDA